MSQQQGTTGRSEQPSAPAASARALSVQSPNVPQQQDTTGPSEQSSAPAASARTLPVQSPNAPRRALLDYSLAPMVPARRGFSARLRRILRIIAIVLAVALVVAAVLTANAFLGGPGTDERVARQASYSPHGTAGDWLDTAYANGYDSWTTDETVLGASANRTVVLTQSGSTGSRDENTQPLNGLDAATGSSQWQVTGLRCMGRDAVLDGSIYCARSADEGGASQIVGVDIATGQERTVFEADEDLSFIEAHGRYGDELVLTKATGSAAQELLVINSDGTLAWRLELPWWGQCRFLGDHLGCVSYADSQVAVVSLTGRDFSLTPTEFGHAGQNLSVDWAWDGFATNDAGDGLARRVRDLNGAELGKVPELGRPEYGSETMLYSHDDLLAGDSRPTKIAVSSDGRAVAVRFGGSIRMLSTRKIIDADFVDLVSSDGAMVLTRTYNHGGRAGADDSWALYSADGTRLQDMPRVTTTVGGLLLDETDGTTTVIAPKH